MDKPEFVVEDKDLLDLRDSDMEADSDEVSQGEGEEEVEYEDEAGEAVVQPASPERVNKVFKEDLEDGDEDAIKYDEDDGPGEDTQAETTKDISDQTSCQKAEDKTTPTTALISEANVGAIKEPENKVTDSKAAISEGEDQSKNQATVDSSQDKQLTVVDEPSKHQDDSEDASKSITEASQSKDDQIPQAEDVSKDERVEGDGQKGEGQEEEAVDYDEDN